MGADVASVAKQIDLDHSPHGSQSGALLVQLREAHERLLGEMVRLDRVTLGPLADGSEFAAARWQLSQASLRRRTLSARIADFLAGRIEEGDARCLKMLQSENQVAVARSARHIRDWTAQAIRQDWTGYGIASRQIRLLMKANILLEQQMLCPILERLADRGL